MATLTISKGTTSSGISAGTGDTDQSITVLSGGTLTGTGSASIIQSGGTLTVNLGGKTSAVQIASSGTELDYGSGTKDIISAGGTYIVESGGHATSAIISGGSVTVDTSGFLQHATVSSGGLITFSSGVVITTGDVNVSAGGSEVILGTTVTDIIFSGGVQTISSGGTASGTTVSSGGLQIVGASGTASGATLASGGAEIVASGGVTSNFVDNEGGIFIQSGGVASGGTIAGGTGGVQGAGVVVSSGGTLSGATLQTSGTIVELVGATVDVASTGGNIVSTGIEIYNPTLANKNFVSATVTSQFSGNTIGGGGTEYVLSGGTATNVTIGSAATLVLDGTGVASGSITFNGGASLVIDGSATVTTATISGFATGNTIDLVGLAYTGSGSASIDGSDVLTVTEGSSDTLQLAGDFSSSYFHLSSDGNGGTDVTVNGTPCYCRGTLILTDRGEVAVEELQIGDQLLTMSGAVRPIRWIGSRSYSARFARGNRDVMPVRFSAGSLGENAPKRDLLVSPLHAMYLDGVLISAQALVNGVSIIQEKIVDKVDYYHIELETHDVIVAEGALSETFVDDDSRGMFFNAAEYSALYPDAMSQPALYCAPRIEDGEEQLEIVRRRLGARALAGKPAPREARRA